ncbi:MAG: iron export ABC transporter permease subunit FetB [Eubacteriales bacterium]|nr:iron export ABC transporter permease subunit FetB [Eubacteriales bacterium]
MQQIIDLSFWQLLSAYVFILILMVIVRLKGIQREKEILIASVRMTVQLGLTGYLLGYIFDTPSPWMTLLILLAMESFAIYTLFKRNKGKLTKKLKRTVALSLICGTVTCLLFFLLVVVRIDPWYTPQYFIPIAGMLIGNSMTGISLGISRLVDGMHDQRDLVEGALMLGATPQLAAKPVVNAAFDAAILPSLNSMLGMGIVFLPGMMTGQILSGTSPLTAISYQIAIMLGIVGAVSLTVILFLQLGYRCFFNEQSQLIVD